MLIAQITDLHVTRPDLPRPWGVDTAARTARVVATLNGLRPRPDLVLITGDLINGPKPGEYQALLPLLADLQIPFLPIPGNHDDKAAMRQAFAPLGVLPAEGPSLHYVHSVGELRILALDSAIPGRTEGLLDRERLDWAAARLAEADGPVLVMLHHPPFQAGIGYMDPIRCFGAEGLEALLRERNDIVGVLCGHIHRTLAVPFAGTTAFCAPSASFQFALELGDGAPAMTDEPPGFALHVWQPGRPLVSHSVALP